MPTSPRFRGWLATSPRTSRSTPMGAVGPGNQSIQKYYIPGVRGLEPPDVISTIFVAAARGRNVSSPTISANPERISPVISTLSRKRHLRVRVLSPQPASPSLIRIKADRARNAAISRRFGHKAWSPRAETAHERGIPVPCLQRDILVSCFMKRAVRSAGCWAPGGRVSGDPALNSAFL